MLAIDPKAARATWTAALTLLFLAAVYAIRGTLVVFAVALLFAYLMQPLVAQMSRHFSPKNRTPALAVTYFLVLGVLASLGIGIASRVSTEARQLIAHPPDVRGFLDQTAAAHPMLAPVLDSARGRIRGQLAEIATTAPQLSLAVLAASANLVYLIVIPILSFFMLKDAAAIEDAFLALFAAGANRAHAERTLADIHVVLLQYMRALLILCCTALAVLGVTLSVVGVRYALLLATIAFFCEFVPMIGPVVEIAIILVVSALTGFEHMWLLAAFLGVFRIVQDYGIWPRLMSRGVELHPLMVIFGVFAGGAIGGVAAGPAP